MFVIKICHSYEQFYITVTKKKLSYEMHQYDKQCLLLLQNFFISVAPIRFFAKGTGGDIFLCAHRLLAKQTYPQSQLCILFPPPPPLLQVITCSSTSDMHIQFLTCIHNASIACTAPCPSASPLRISSSSQQSNLLRYYVSSNYTVILDESETVTNLHINVTVEPNTTLYLLEWMHNGYIVKATEHPRIEISSNGSLTVNEVQPSDAGSYVVAVSSNLGCDSVAFNVEVQC